jgi:hypothetical protein
MAFDNGGGANLAGARGRWGAFGGGRTFDFRASRTRAGGAFTLGLITLGAIEENGLRLGNGGLEDIVAQIGNRRYFALQDVVAQIRTGGARWHRRLQNISG